MAFFAACRGRAAAVPRVFDVWHSSPTSRAAAHGGLGRRTLAGTPEVLGSPPAAAGQLRVVGDGDVDQLVRGGQPFLLHFGVRWSTRSRAVESRLAEWVVAEGDGAGLLCAAVDVETSPRVVAQQHIRSVPTVLFVQHGRVQQRADGADVTALERILAAARGVSSAMSSRPTAEQPPQELLAAAEELVRRRADPSAVLTLYREILESKDGSARNFAFRARLGILGCALRAVEGGRAQTPPPGSPVDQGPIDQLGAALADLVASHEAELRGDGEDAEEVARLVAHAGLLVDAWAGSAAGEELEVLRHYYQGEAQAAVDAALRWYQRAAGSDIPGLVLSYCMQGDFPDKPHLVPSTSYMRKENFAFALDDAPGPAVPRALLRRLFTALGPTHEIVHRARADLEFLLDTKRWVPFHTRFIQLRKGGRPQTGRGTGKRSGASRRYWLAWGPGTTYRNTKPMGSPHCDKND